MGAQAMRSTDILGIGKTFEAFDRPALNITHKVKGRKGRETTFSLDISKFDVIIGLVVATALYIALKRHMQGHSTSEELYGNMYGLNPFMIGGGVGGSAGGGSVGQTAAGSLFTGLPGSAGLLSAPYRWYVGSQWLAEQAGL